MTEPSQQKEAAAVVAQSLTVLGSGELPVSFFDALHLLQWLQRAGEPGGRTIHQLLALHDAEHLSRGARRLLADFLRSLAQRRAEEIARGNRPLRLADQGKRARIQVGATLEVHLPPGGEGGRFWEAAAGAPSWLRITQAMRGEESSGKTLFRVKPTRAGSATVRFCELRRLSSGALEPCREFSFQLVAEPRG